MIKSMTGFGRCELNEGNRKIAVEIKSVNHRYFEVNMKMPKKLNFFDASIRKLLKEYIQRGKVDVFISYEDLSESNVTVSYHKEVAQEYVNFLNEISRDFNLGNDLNASSLARFPEVLTLDDAEIDEEGIWKILEKAVRGAAEGFVQSRITEGEHLQADLVEKLDEMYEDVLFIEKRSPEIIEEYKNHLHEKVQEMLGDSQMDESRILTEVTIFADKVCVDEELVRLKSHIQTTKETIVQGGEIGRKLDFLAQEMNREANTILSKTTDLEISNRGIELKTMIEKVREQIQNIE